MHRAKKLILIEFYAFFLIVGCTNIQVQEEKKFNTSIGANEKISFILDRSAIKDVEDAQRIELKIEKCIDKALKKLEPPVQTVSAESFRKAAFPGMDYLSVPSSPDSILTLLNSSEFNRRIKPLGLRYLLVLHSESGFSNQVGECGGGSAVICLFFWDKKTNMSACVLDLANGCNAGEVKTEAVGHGWFIFAGVFPLGFPAISEGPACNALGKQVAKFIAGSRQKQEQSD